MQITHLLTFLLLKAGAFFIKVHSLHFMTLKSDIEDNNINSLLVFHSGLFYTDLAHFQGILEGLFE